MVLGNVVLRRKLQSTFCECEALASLRYTYLGSFFLEPEDIRKLSKGPTGTLLKEQGSSNLVWNMGHKGPVLRPRCTGPGRAQTQILFYSILPISPSSITLKISVCKIHPRFVELTDHSCFIWM